MVNWIFFMDKASFAIHNFFFVYVNSILLNYSQVLVNGLQLDQALWACRLHERVSLQTLHNHIKRAEAASAGTTSGVRRARKTKIKTTAKEGMVVEFVPPASDDSGPSSTTTDTSPLTMWSSDFSSTTSVKKKRIRRTSRQVSEANIQEKLERDDYNRRFKQAFKEGTRDLARISDQTPHHMPSMNRPTSSLIG